MQLFDISFPWLLWMESLLLGLLLMICAIQPSAVVHGIQTIVSPIQRRYASGDNHPVIILLKALFQLVTVSLALLVAVSTWVGQYETIIWHHFLLVSGLLLGTLFIKWIIDRWIQITFRCAMNGKTYYSFRSELWQLISILLLVMLLFTPYIGGAAGIIPMVVFGLYFIVLWWKIMQVFGWSLEHIGYSLLYLLHAEVLPLLVVIGGTIRILS